ncbi:hypothetical protein [Paracraurococcus ruber]|uniref:hypothetical protein n=1 Tax=Paracraurococcus ruber TaxID=77675 RepID=UPI001057B5A2|nr:hypothetical protein [Paracraurococcus ruber]TDG34098.1 hypothetical protein E2C05_01075 [Paracraurococcus ruber]
MAGSKHPRGPEDRKGGLGADKPRPPDDLERNPGIGASKGTQASTGTDPEEIEATNTSEGDVLNDADRTGGVKPDQRGCTNRYGRSRRRRNAPSAPGRSAQGRIMRPGLRRPPLRCRARGGRLPGCAAG